MVKQIGILMLFARKTTKTLVKLQQPFIMKNLRDRIADKDRELQTANFQLSQQAQNATLINELRPCAKPAYITCSPYTSANYGCCCGV